MTEQEILEAITGTSWGMDVLGLPSSQKIVSPEKLAAFLSKHLPKEE